MWRTLPASAVNLFLTHKNCKQLVCFVVRMPVKLTVAVVVLGFKCNVLYVATRQQYLTVNGAGCAAVLLTATELYRPFQ
jgi:hypothetical protein